MATKKEDTKAQDTDPGEDEDEESDDADPATEFLGRVRAEIDDALAAWTKKNKPAPRRTDPSGEGQPSFWESLFGKS